jgi:YgiT-type zinc finger domain-containing protein
MIITMICVICKRGQTRPGNATLALERGSMTLVVKAVPAQVCEICGESYVDEDTTAHLIQQAAEASKAGVEVEVRTYVAA